MTDLEYKKLFVEEYLLESFTAPDGVLTWGTPDAFINSFLQGKKLSRLPRWTENFEEFAERFLTGDAKTELKLQWFL